VMFRPAPFVPTATRTISVAAHNGRYARLPMPDFFGRPYDPDNDTGRLTRILCDCIAYAATVDPDTLRSALQKLTRFELAALAAGAVIAVESGQAPDGDAEAFEDALSVRLPVNIDDLTFERHQQLRAGVVALLDAHDDLDAAIETTFTARSNAVRTALVHLRQLLGDPPRIGGSQDSPR
jgi:hypothetical protein